MKVAFISPRGAMRNQQNSILNRLYDKLRGLITFIEVDDIEFMPNLGLLTIAGFFPRDWELRYLEEDYVNPNRREETLFDRDYDLVCLSACNNQAYRAYRIADAFRSRGAKVIMGGLHASALPEEAAQHCDAVLIGEGEDTVKAFLDDFQKGEIKQFYRSSGEYDLTKSPIPRFDLVEDIRRFNKINVQATRGCPRNCGYCSTKAAYGSRYRTKTVEQVRSEIRAVKALYPNPFISFADDNLLAKREYALELLKMLEEEQVRWECYCDIGIYQDEELLQALALSNCVELLIGLETVNEESLKGVSEWKTRMLPHYREAIDAIQAHGLAVLGLFMLGFDGDRPDVFAKMQAFIEESRLFDVDFAILCPIPGTRVFEALDQEGRILSKDWDRYTWYHVNYQPKHLTEGELRDGIMRLFEAFNRPEQIFRRKQYFDGIFRKLYGNEALLQKKLELLELGL